MKTSEELQLPSYLRHAMWMIEKQKKNSGHLPWLTREDEGFDLT